MTHPIIGWEREEAVPNHTFNDYLSSRKGRLYFEDLDLAQILIGGREDQGLGAGAMPNPLELIYLPAIPQKIARMKRIFAEVIAEVGYKGRFHYAYASKANTAEEVVRESLKAGAHYEMSSMVDVEIAEMMIEAGYLPPERMIIANGFKPGGSSYAADLVQLKPLHPNLIPVVESLAELPPLLESGRQFDLGLRQKSYGHHQNAAEMEIANSRFGMSTEELRNAADIIAAAPNLNLKLYHAMVGSQITDEEGFVKRLEPAIEGYAHLRRRHPGLSIFDFGGGMPVAMTLDFQFDYHRFVRLLLTTFQEICGERNVPVPDIMGEFGRYTTAEHGAHFFKVILVKENASALPWYIINSSIMSSFPDTWCLAEHFIVLPLNHLDKAFRRVQLGGVTCDSDDVYPPKSSQSPLYLPVETDELYIGFFGIGAYQEMLGGVRGSKHCSLPEATELIVDRDDEGEYRFRAIAGQTKWDVMENLGYKVIK